eukprot:10789373-Prorocentrum_lima.AAC.1
MVERHHAILRQAFLKIREQVAEEGLTLDGQQLLTLAVLAKNTFTTVGQYSRMQATLGYQPGLLPDIDK